MVTPMTVIMLFEMRHMLPDRRLNLAIAGLAAVVFLGAFTAMRQQAFVDDEQFLRSMIPHHSMALEMCGHAEVQDPEVVELCRQIVRSQRTEISQMRAILERMD